LTLVTIAPKVSPERLTSSEPVSTFWTDSSMRPLISRAAVAESRPDDYPQLVPGGAGHPGRAGYSAIAAYTIQVDDGAGQYRLVGSSIMKGDSAVSPYEDGLDVLLYVNSLLLGSQAVSVNGAAASFDRD
jgi:hypothetical protein